MLMIKNRWIVLWFGVVALFAALILTLGADRTFAIWGIDATVPDFVDVRGMTSALESHRLGKDPLIENPSDPFQRAFNYPRVWLGLSLFGINQSHSTLISYSLICLFLLGLLISAPRDLDWYGLCLMLPVAFSPASLLGMERGNIDLLMFFLVAIGIAGLASGKSMRKLLGVASVLLGFILKLYPLFGLAMLLDGPWRSVIRRMFWIPVAAGLYVFLIRHDLLLIYQSTPRAMGLSYGMNVLWMELTEHGRVLGIAARLLAWMGVTIAFGLAWLGNRRETMELSALSGVAKSLVAFRAGAGIYLGTFLLGNNWDYRLVFLIFTLQLLANLIRSGSSCQRRVAGIVAAGVIVSCWHITLYHVIHAFPFGSPACVLLDECANWTVFLGLSYLLGNTLASWRHGETPSQSPQSPHLTPLPE